MVEWQRHASIKMYDFHFIQSNVKQRFWCKIIIFKAVSKECHLQESLNAGQMHIFKFSIICFI